MESIVLREVETTRRLLVAFGHPDDESFGPAATLARYADEGVAVHYACATRGEAGHADAELLAGYDSVAELRTAELLCAAGHLGLAGVHLLGYRDSGMENTPDNEDPASLMQAPLGEVVAKIARLMREIRPQVVLTHDASGGYFHPDHIKVHQATVAAFHAAGDPDRFPEQLAEGLAAYQPQKLYFTVFPRGMVRFVVRALSLVGRDPEAFGRNGDINLKRIAEVDQPVTAKIGIGPYLQVGEQAARCHASQTGGHSGWVVRLLGRLVRNDRFTRAVPPFAGGRVERDLFAGVDGGDE